MSRKQNKPPQEYMDLLSEYLRESPKNVNGIWNSSAQYWREWLLKKVFSCFQFSGFPETWDLDYFLLTLFLKGYITVCDTAAGVLPLECGYTGINWFNEPTHVQVANPVLGSFQKEIGKDCVLIKLQYSYRGIEPILNRYSELLASCDSSMTVNLMNAKVSEVFFATSKTQAETMKLMYDKISQGEPAVFVREADFNGENVYSFPVKNQFVADQIEELQTLIKRQFFQEIGVNAINSYKRERQSTVEVDAGDEEKLVSVQHWLDNISHGLDQINAMFGLNTSVKLREYLTAPAGNNGGEQNEPQ